MYNNMMHVYVKIFAAASVISCPMSVYIVGLSVHTNSNSHGKGVRIPFSRHLMKWLHISMPVARRRDCYSM